MAKGKKSKPKSKPKADSKVQPEPKVKSQAELDHEETLSRAVAPENMKSGPRISEAVADAFANFAIGWVRDGLPAEAFEDKPKPKAAKKTRKQK